MRLSLRASLRQVLPRPVYAALAVICLLSIELTWFLLEQFAGPNTLADQLLLIRDTLIVGLLTAYGVYRVVSFHPLLSPDYLRWLKATPWKRGVPLPIGPVHPVVADAIVVLAFSALLADSRVLSVLPVSRPPAIAGVMACLLAYATTVTMMVWFTYPRRLAYLASFVLAASVQVSAWNPPAAIVLLLAGWMVAQVGLSLSWEHFPWDHTLNPGDRIKQRWKQMQAHSGAVVDDDPSPDRVPASELGWPFGPLSPWVPPASLSHAEQTLIVAMFCWWLHAALVHVTNKEFLQGAGMMFLGYGTMILAIKRLARYGVNHASPLNFQGRLLKLRWIVPGYDQIFVGPLVIVFAAATLGYFGRYWLQIPPAMLIPAITVCILWVSIWIGPSPEKWKLTAPVRIVHGAAINKRNYDQLS